LAAWANSSWAWWGLVDITSDATIELDCLVPRSRWWTIPLVVIVTVILVVAAWFAPPWLNPRLDQYSSGGAQAIPDTAFVATQTKIVIRGTVTISGVTDISGAQPILSWVTHTTDQTQAAQSAWDALAALSCSTDGRTCGPSAVTASPADANALRDDLQTQGWSVPGLALPQRANSGDQLWVVWQVSACPAKGPDGAAWAVIDPQLGVRLRSPLGFTVTQYGAIVVGPFDFGTDWLHDMEVCPV